jgi:hypothetical protein
MILNTATDARSLAVSGDTIISMRLTLLIICSTLIISCKQPLNQKKNNRVEVELFPAFSEPSLLQFERMGDTGVLSFLIRYYEGVSHDKDTFYYRSTVLTQLASRYFDSLIDNWPKISATRTVAVLDGIHFIFSRLNNHDTSRFSFQSPSLRTDSLGFKMTSSLISTIDRSFHDSLISDYLIEIRSYIENDSNVENTPRPILFNRRKSKYGWEYRR